MGGEQNLVELWGDSVVVEQRIGQQTFLIGAELDRDWVAVLEQETHFGIIAARGQQAVATLAVGSVEMFNKDGIKHGQRSVGLIPLSS
jgi:hypothetical protein